MAEQPIRVLQVVTHMNRGGLETMIMNYYRKMDRNKIQFDFLTHRPENEKKDYDDEIREMGGKIYHISRLNPLSSSYIKELRIFFDNHQEYKIIHVHQDCLSSVILKVAKEAGIKVRIAHCHSSNQDKNLKYLLKLYYKRKIKKYATKMIACGEASGKWMFGKNVEFTVLPNAIDTNKFLFSIEKRKEVRDKLNIKDGEIVIGHVGRFCDVKNHSFMVNLMKNICENNNNYKMVFVGQGELMDAIKNKVNSCGLQNKIVFLGLRSDVPDLLQAFDFFILPSKYEGVPVSIIEAQATGIKCVISNKVPRECIISSLVVQLPVDNGYDEWIDYLTSNESYVRENMKTIICNANFDIDKNVNELSDIYFDII